MPIAIENLAAEAAAREALASYCRSMIAEAAVPGADGEAAKALKRLFERRSRTLRKSRVAERSTLEGLAALEEAAARFELRRVSAREPDAERARVAETMAALVDGAFAEVRELIDCEQLDPDDFPPAPPVEIADDTAEWQLRHLLNSLTCVRITDGYGTDDMWLGGSWSYAGRRGELTPWEAQFPRPGSRAAHRHELGADVTLVPGSTVYVGTHNLRELDWQLPEDAAETADDIAAFVTLLLTIALEVGLEAASAAAAGAAAAYGVPPPLVYAVLALLKAWLAAQAAELIARLAQLIDEALTTWLSHELFEQFLLLVFIDWQPPRPPSWQAVVQNTPFQPPLLHGRGSANSQGAPEVRELVRRQADAFGGGAYRYQLSVQVRRKPG